MHTWLGLSRKLLYFGLGMAPVIHFSVIDDINASKTFAVSEALNTVIHQHFGKEENGVVYNEQTFFPSHINEISEYVRYI